MIGRSEERRGLFIGLPGGVSERSCRDDRSSQWVINLFK